MSINPQNNTVDGKPVVDTVEREQLAQRDLLAAVDGMSVDAVKRSCAWLVDRVMQDTNARHALNLASAVQKAMRGEKS